MLFALCAVAVLLLMSIAGYLGRCAAALERIATSQETQAGDLRTRLMWPDDHNVVRLPERDDRGAS
jgi:hypothetical protein